MTVRIYRPAKTSMQSGRGNRSEWVLEYEPATPKRADPLMGWQGSGDTLGQIHLKFPTCEAAVAYATAKGLAYEVLPDQVRALKIQTYAENFK